MRILVLGGTGMLGHQLYRSFHTRHETWTTLRGRTAQGLPDYFDPRRCLPGVDACAFDTVARALTECRPDVVVNAIGVVKQVADWVGPIGCIQTNALYPHQLGRLCADQGARLIHISTDCVFSGVKGNYTEEDPTDPEDLYGRTKVLGEVQGPQVLTMRTSFIGPELRAPTGLLGWFLAQNGQRLRGFTRAIFSGWTSRALADVLLAVIEQHPALAGLHHVAAHPISKYDLLCKLRDAFGVKAEIEPYDGMRCDRSLNAARFRAATGLPVPSWDQMVADLRAHFEKETV